MPVPDPAIIARAARSLPASPRLSAASTSSPLRTNDAPTRPTHSTAYRAIPLAVVLPASTEEVAEVLRYLGSAGVKIIPRGAGTSLSGGALPSEMPSWSALRASNRILAIDYDNRIARVEAGVTNITSPTRCSRAASSMRPIRRASRLHHRRQHRHELRAARIA